MNMTVVESTTLVTVAYDEALGVLQLEFVAGRSIGTSAFLQLCMAAC